MGLHMSYNLQGAVGDLSSSQILTAINLLRHVYGGRRSTPPYHGVSPTVFPAGTYFSTQHVPSEPCGRDWLVTHQVISFFLKGTQLVPFQSPFGWVMANGKQVDVRVSLPSVKPPVSPPSTFALLSCLLARGRDQEGGGRATKWEQAYVTTGSHQIPSSHPQMKLSTQTVSQVIAESSYCSHGEIVHHVNNMVKPCSVLGSQY